MFDMFKEKLRNKKIVILIISVMVLSIVGFVVVGSQKPLSVETVRIDKIDFEDYHFEESTVKSKDSVKVYSSGGGNISELLVKEGSLVKKGEIILRIDVEDLDYELGILKAQKNSLVAQKQSESKVVKQSEIDLQKESIQIARNNVAQMAVEMERKKKLFNSGAISKTTFEGLEKDYKKAVSELNIEEFKLSTLLEGIKQGENRDIYFDTQIKKIDLEIKNIEDKITKMNVVAPIDGVISDLNVRRGDLVGVNDQLFNIFNPGLYEIESYVLAREVKNLSVGMQAYIELDGNTIKEVKGVITYIAPNAVDLTSPLGLIEKKVKVIIDPIHSDDFILGEDVDVKFVTYSKSNAQIVSKDYVFPVDGGEAVWIIEDGKAKIMKINKEFDTSASIILKDEISTEMEIIIPPYPDKLEEGAKVRGI